MADWFSELVRQVSDDAATSSETASRLELTELTDRVSPGQLVDAVTRSEDELRTQFVDSVRAIQEIRDNIQLIERQVLRREWQAVSDAGEAAIALLRRYEQPPEPEPEHKRVRARRQRILLYGRLGQASVQQAFEDAQKMINDAHQAYEAAKASKEIDQLEPIRKLRADQAEGQLVLRDLLYPALMLKVNEVIDDLAEASYERDFSYAEPAKLTDPLNGSVQKLVNTDAYEKIKYFVDKVGSGTIGVAGPRGSGKSTLLNRFALTVSIDDAPRQWGVCVAAPAKYDPRDFLLHLFAQLCAEVLGRDRVTQMESRLTSTGMSTKSVFPATRLFGFIGAAVLACLAVVIGLRTARLGESPDRMTDLLVASCAAIVLFASYCGALYLVPVQGTIGNALDVGPGYLSSHLRERYRKVRYTKRVLVLTCLLSFLATTALFGLLLAGDAPDPGYLAAGGLGVASVIYVAALIYPGEQRIRRTIDFMGTSIRWPGDPAYIAAARDWYVKVKFQQSFTTGWSGTMTIGSASLPAQAQGGISGNTAVTPMAMSVPEIVAALRSFTQSLARSSRELPRTIDREAVIPVIIGIDEVDKIEDPQDAQVFLNQIKGLFSDSSCIFLISISDDAMAAFERRGMPFRDAFDSSLSSVVTLSYLSRKEARTLTGSRLVGVQQPVADLLFVLAGGLPRDLVRLIRRAVEAKEQGMILLDGLAVALIAAEVEAKKKAVLVRARTLEQCAARDNLLIWAGRRYSQAPDGERHDKYFAELLGQAVALIDSACDGVAHQNVTASEAGGCVAREIGVFGFWLVTVGQVFAVCTSREDFLDGESTDHERSFERLTEAKQNFQLGPDYVLAAIKAVRTAWGLPEGLGARTTVRSE